MHALYDLCSRPEYMAPLREEVEALASEGWTASNVSKMRKLDSFLKESIRLHPLGAGDVPTHNVVDRSWASKSSIGTLPLFKWDNHS
jgi:hypothetical protein